MRSRHIFVRFPVGSDAKEFVEWTMANRDKNLFDPRVFQSKQTIILCAFNKAKKILFMPISRTYFLESSAPNPDASEFEKASALKEVVQAVVTECYKTGTTDIYFLASDPAVEEFAKSNGFEQIKLPVYRMKISDLEPNE